MKKILLLLFAMTNIIIVWSQTQPYQGIIYVTPTGAGTRSGDSWANATSSIATAQSLAQTHNCVVWVAAGIYYGDTSSTAENAFIMVDGVNVYGGFAGNEPANYDLQLRDFETNASILDGDSARRVLCQNNDFNTQTTWDGFSIRNGYSFSDNTSLNLGGGGVYVRGNVELSHCNIYSNTHTTSIIPDHTSPTYHSYIYDGGGGVYVGGPNNLLSYCNIYDNTSNSHGAGVLAYSWGGTLLTISHCQVNHNSSINSGGGVYVCEGWGSVSIDSCIISDNTSTYGGGMWVDASPEFRATIESCIISDNTSYWGVGGVYATNSFISHCQITHNTATSSLGGGVYASNSSISQCYITHNTSYGAGGGVEAGNSSISQCYITHNTSYGAGGGVEADNSSISHCYITHNSSSSGNGGGVDANNTSISNCIIANNTADYGGGVSARYYGVIFNSTTIVKNTALTNGAGVYVVGGTRDTLRNCIIWGNERNGSMDNLYDLYNDCTITYCAVEGVEGEGNVPVYYNNGLFHPHFVNPSLTAGASDTTANVDWHLQSNSICINKGNNDVVTDSLDIDGTIRIKRDTVDIGCYESDFYGMQLSDFYSGIVYVTPTGAGSHSGESWDNAVSSIAEAQYIALMCNADVWVAAGTYYGDTSSTSKNAFTMKKGVSLYGGFAGNEPADYDLNLRDFETNASILDGNSARRVLSMNEDMHTDIQAVCDGFTIQNGIAPDGFDGGGVEMYKDAVLRNCMIRNNTATRNGGGIYMNGGTVANCQIFNNTANKDGGGVEVQGTEASTQNIISNCLIFNNTATYYSGGVEFTVNYDTNSIIKNSTIVRNKAIGASGGISGRGTIHNSIIWGNESPIGANIGPFWGQYYNSSPTCSYCAVEGGFEGEHNIDISDMQIFVNPSLTAGAEDTISVVDWHLLPDTVCINQGNNVFVMDSADLDGLPRILCDVVDLGCYESYYYLIELYQSAFDNYSWHGSTYNESGVYIWIDPDSEGCDTVYRLHLTITTGIANHGNTVGLLLYPNPTSDVVNVQLTINNEQLDGVSIQVFDVYGRLLEVINMADARGASLQTTQIDLSRYAKGVYFVKAASEGKVIAVRKVVKR